MLVGMGFLPHKITLSWVFCLANSSYQILTTFSQDQLPGAKQTLPIRLYTACHIISI